MNRIGMICGLVMLSLSLAAAEQVIVPFREGNGRTQRLYFTQWLRHLGYDVDFSSVDPDVFLFATIHAAQGILDDLKGIFAEQLP